MKEVKEGNMTFEKYVAQVETYLDMQLPPIKYVIFFDYWFRWGWTPKYAAKPFTEARNGK